MVHKFTREEQSKGGRTRAAQDSFPEHCENAYEMLKLKRPDVWRKIYETKVKPAMKGKKG